jgi:predicted Rossmann-fold nucleotide-binding protein
LEGSEFVSVFVCVLSLQITGEPVGEVKAVADMHQRKAEMARQSDAFIALPGLFYTLIRKQLVSVLQSQLGCLMLLLFYTIINSYLHTKEVQETMGKFFVFFR